MHSKYLALVTGMVIFSATIVSAQPRAEGYAVGAGGGWFNTFNSGGLFGGATGIEVLATPHIGVGAEIGALTDLRGGLLVPLSFDGRVHLTRGQRLRAWTPFALAGYSRLFSFDLSRNAAHFGAGADYRLDQDRAVRFEFRDIVDAQRSFREHYWSVRIGMTFRDR